MSAGRVAGELYVLAGCFAAGLAAGVLYDAFRLIRLPFRKSRLRDAVFDIAYYAAAGAMFAFALYSLNGGSPRLYALAGFALGAFAYAKTAGDAFTGIAQSLSDRIAQSRARRRKQEK
ncbi:MAG TPA: spore cortex biosynthesis protein YabQ [Clostridia bacterium]|nr:MAG: Spore cortex protein YabQ (Spore_YabQ) [Firmicutes bacterium ADurb.Bin248]HOG00210.1 spore cortex biosynthesis protein YabQ [Clostridia bacterium]HOS19327.1 spore cortex biosynthesis protein YabQ [Clostridia bacterium]HPK15100.1 spore cortex biosynthesis protein YabQ [Clostridia bacterium]